MQPFITSQIAAYHKKLQFVGVDSARKVMLIVA